MVSLAENITEKMGKLCSTVELLPKLWRLEITVIIIIIIITIAINYILIINYLINLFNLIICLIN